MLPAGIIIGYGVVCWGEALCAAVCVLALLSGSMGIAWLEKYERSGVCGCMRAVLLPVAYWRTVSGRKFCGQAACEGCCCDLPLHCMAERALGRACEGCLLLQRSRCLERVA